jgi:hypothetical protein
MFGMSNAWQSVGGCVRVWREGGEGRRKRRKKIDIKEKHHSHVNIRIYVHFLPHTLLPSKAYISNNIENIKQKDILKGNLRLSFAIFLTLKGNHQSVENSQKSNILYKKKVSGKINKIE